MDKKENKTSKAKLATNAKYLSQFKAISLRLREPERDALAAHAASMGESVNAYIVRAVRERMEREGASL